jgi:hypothetical protein
VTPEQQREAQRVLASMEVDLSDFSDEFVWGFVQGVKAERGTRDRCGWKGICEKAVGHTGHHVFTPRLPWNEAGASP